jgi:putative flippase GtrA
MAEALRRITLPPGLALVLRFAMAGVLNTLVGLSITLTLDIGFHVKPALANAAGYAVGLVVSWFLQQRFVFRSQSNGWDTKIKWATTIAAAFALNQAVLAAMPMLVGDAPLARTFSQLVAMGTYTVFQFIVMRLWVFRGAQNTPPADA